MAISRRCVVVLLWVSSMPTHAGTLSAFPRYCAKDMDANAIPRLNDSIARSFGGEVSLADVELLQVGGCSFASQTI